MSPLILQAADWFFLIFHSCWTVFNLTGWIFRKTRKIHLAAMALTAFSWFVLGLRYGIGYCVCTEWHWQVRRLLNRPIRSRSYILFLIEELTGASPDPRFVDIAVMTLFTATAIVTIYINVRDYLQRTKG